MQKTVPARQMAGRNCFLFNHCGFYASMPNMKITITGLAGTGKSTVAHKIAEKFGYEFFSSGNMFREKARALGWTIDELDQHSKNDPKYDNELDQEVQKMGLIHDAFVFDSRLAWYFIPDSTKILLTCDNETRIKRIADRENKTVEQVKAETLAREEAIYDRYKKYYKIEKFDDEKNFDLIVDTTHTNVDEVMAKISEYIKKKQKEVPAEQEII